MSTYAVNKICYRVRFDPAFREALRRDPASALADADLTDDERAALLAGDVRRLHDLGAHGYLLNNLQRYENLLGLTHAIYVQRMHQPSPLARGESQGGGP